MRSLLTPTSVILLSLGVACAPTEGAPDNASEPPPAAVPVEGRTTADAPSSATPPTEENAPSDGDLCELGDDWMACDGKMVKVSGTRPRMVSQHPVVSGPVGPEPDAPETHQSYLDVGDLQVIVVSAEKNMCDEKMTVVGRLERIDLGGAPGTKNSYKGWEILEAEVTCD